MFKPGVIVCWKDEISLNYRKGKVLEIYRALDSTETERKNKIIYMIKGEGYEDYFIDEELLTEFKQQLKVGDTVRTKVEYNTKITGIIAHLYKEWAILIEVKGLKDRGDKPLLISRECLEVIE